MAAKEPIAKESDRATSSAAKQTHASSRSQAAVPKSEQGAESRPAPRVSPLDAVPSLAERVQLEREQLFKAISIVECCRFATATLLEVSDSEYMTPAFEVVRDLLNDSATELEGIASECEKVS